jgi:hypothetical protein
MNDEILEIILPFTIHTTNKYQTREVLEELFPGVLIKIYTGNASEITNCILGRTVRVVDSKTFEVDSEMDSQLTGVVNFLECELLPYGLDPNVSKVLETYVPFRAKFLNSTGVAVKCQKRRDENTRLLPLLLG